MPRLLGFSDPHIHPHKDRLERLDDCFEAVEWALQVGQDCDGIFCAGDLFHDKKAIWTIAYSKTFELFEKYNKKPILILLGNHDMWYSEKYDISSIKPLRALPHIMIVDNIETVNFCGVNIDCIPYTKNPIDAIKKFDVKSNLLIGHLAVNGAILNNFHNTTADVSVEQDNEMVKVDSKIFNSWKKVFLGHYHCYQKLSDSVEYIGSPLQLNFAEVAQEKIILIYDTENNTTEYLTNNFSPKHYVINQRVDDWSFVNNSYIKINLDESLNSLLDLKNFLIKSYNPKNIEVVKKSSIKIEASQVDFAKSKGNYLERFVDSTKTTLNRKKLMDTVENIISEATENV